jgi:hypothetical protein
MAEWIVLHREAIQTIARTINKSSVDAMDGFDDEDVFALAPAKLDTEQLPALYTLTQNANYFVSQYGENLLLATRVYRIQVPVIPIGQANAETRESLCQPLLETVTKTFIGYPTLNNCEGVQAGGSKVVSDSGIVVLPEYGAKFVGFQVNLQVNYLIPRIFAVQE